MNARLAVDIGGTFTDVVLADGDALVSAKVLTTYPDPAHGFMAAVAQALERAGRASADVGVIVHGTTLATNALIERKGARTALLTTAGFRDVIEIGTESRFALYDLFIRRPEPLVPRARPLASSPRRPSSRRRSCRGNSSPNPSAQNSPRSSSGARSTRPGRRSAR